MQRRQFAEIKESEQSIYASEDWLDHYHAFKTRTVLINDVIKLVLDYLEYLPKILISLQAPRKIRVHAPTSSLERKKIYSLVQLKQASDRGLLERLGLRLEQHFEEDVITSELMTYISEVRLNDYKVFNPYAPKQLILPWINKKKNDREISPRDSMATQNEIPSLFARLESRGITQADLNMHPIGKEIKRAFDAKEEKKEVIVMNLPDSFYLEPSRWLVPAFSRSCFLHCHSRFVNQFLHASHILLITLAITFPSFSLLIHLNDYDGVDWRLYVNIFFVTSTFIFNLWNTKIVREIVWAKDNAFSEVERRCGGLLIILVIFMLSNSATFINTSVLAANLNVDLLFSLFLGLFFTYFTAINSIHLDYFVLNSFPVGYDITQVVNTMYAHCEINKKIFAGILALLIAVASEVIVFGLSFVNIPTLLLITTPINYILNLPSILMRNIYLSKFIYHFLIDKRDITVEDKPYDSDFFMLTLLNKGATKFLLAIAYFILLLDEFSPVVAASFSINILSYFLLSNALVHFFDFKIPPESKDNKMPSIELDQPSAQQSHVITIHESKSYLVPLVSPRISQLPFAFSNFKSSSKIPENNEELDNHYYVLN